MSSSDLDFEIPDDKSLFDWVLGYESGLQCNGLISDVVLNFVARNLEMYPASYNDVPPPTPGPSSRELQLIQTQQTFPEMEVQLRILEAPGHQNINTMQVAIRNEVNEMQVSSTSTYNTVVKCKICHREDFPNYAQLREHLIKIHKVKTSTTPFISRNGVFGQQMLSCQDCDRAFKTPIEYLTHSSVRSFICLECEETFLCVYKWHTHFSNLHLSKTDNRCTKCKLCKRELSSKYNLLNHYSTHLKNLQYYCKFCVFTCRTSRGLHNHLKNAHQRQLDTFVLPNPIRTVSTVVPHVIQLREREELELD